MSDSPLYPQDLIEMQHSLIFLHTAAGFSFPLYGTHQFLSDRTPVHHGLNKTTIKNG